jgi:hypothetical protein
MTIPVEQVSPYLSRLVGVRGVCERYSISLRSVDRWLSKRIIPPPDRVTNSRRYWYLDSLERADRQHVANAANSVTAAE